jgi:hypothetical protein
MFHSNCFKIIVSLNNSLMICKKIALKTAILYSKKRFKLFCTFMIQLYAIDYTLSKKNFL